MLCCTRPRCCLTFSRRAWLACLQLRISRQQESALRIAELLSRHPLVHRVLYAGLPSHPQHSLHSSQSSGGGSVISFDCDAPLSADVLNEVQLWKRCVSFGGVTSSAELPFYFSHASVDAATKVKHAVAEQVSKGLIRLSVGIEHCDDLIDDLQQAMNKAQAQLNRATA